VIEDEACWLRGLELRPTDVTNPDGAQDAEDLLEPQARVINL
jgi:hypothetical protein